jgi:hypothetical protein
MCGEDERSQEGRKENNGKEETRGMKAEQSLGRGSTRITNIDVLESRFQGISE